MIDGAHQRPEAGGTSCDVDGDGDLDLILGGDAGSRELWWYENPAPNFDPKTSWKKHIIKHGGGTAHHDQAVADFKGAGKPQLMFWNQGAKKLFMAEIPKNPRAADSWPLTEIIDTSSIPTANKQEGMDVADMDGDGKPDLLAGIFWFKYAGDNRFKATRICEHPGRIAAGHFKPGKIPQVVVAPGDGSGPLLFLECQGNNPANPKAWKSRDLLGRTVVHGHSLQVADINRDGHLDIFCAEMGKWSDNASKPDNPNANAWILYGDGQGHFETTVFIHGMGFHEARVADVNGDGKLDIVSKPYGWDTPRLDIWVNQGAVH